MGDQDDVILLAASRIVRCLEFHASYPMSMALHSHLTFLKKKEYAPQLTAAVLNIMLLHAHIP